MGLPYCRLEEASSDHVVSVCPREQYIHEVAVLLLEETSSDHVRAFIYQPHLRFDGVYVSRNTYVRRGIIEMTARTPVHLVVYFRYYRFFPDGTLLYRTSPATINKVSKGMRNRDAANIQKVENLFLGRYILKGTKGCANIQKVENLFLGRSTEIRSILHLRSTHPGANNRLDLESIVSFDRDLNSSTSMVATNDPDEPEPHPGQAQRCEHKRGLTSAVFVPWSQVNSHVLNLPEPHPGQAQRCEHKRGLTSAVFVPWSQANSHVLNLPPSQMDVYLPG
eukprot:gene27374-4678_t